MYHGRTAFSQVLDFLPMHKFRRCVDRYNGNKGVRTFTCLDQYMCMAFAQLTYRESLRDIECCLRAMNEKLYHMGGFPAGKPAPGLGGCRGIDCSPVYCRGLTAFQQKENGRELKASLPSGGPRR
jgi:hypothetical protein